MNTELFLYPPYYYLLQVASNNPKAVYLYMLLWKHHKDRRISIAISSIRHQFLISPARFRNDLLVLVKEGLISILEKKDESFITIEYEIELTGWDDE